MEDLRLCFLDLAVIVFVDLDEFVLDRTERVFVFDTGFCFLDPCTCFVIGPDVLWTLAPSFFV